MSKNVVNMMMGLFVLLAFGLTGCGGGGGGGAADVGTLYTGKTTQAVVDASNAKAVSEEALGSVQQSVSIGGAGGMFKSASDAPQSSFQIQPVISILKNCALKTRSKQAVAKTVASVESGNELGYTGSYDYSFNINDSTGAGSGTITFKSYVAYSGAPVISGAMSVSGSDGPGVDDFSVTVNMSNISVTASPLSLTMNGIIGVIGTATKETVTASIVILDNSTKKTHYMKDLKMELTNATGKMTISGTFYNNDYGYVVISTTTPLATYDFDSYISSGELLFTGANGTKARLVFPGPSTYWYNGTSFTLVP